MQFRLPVDNSTNPMKNVLIVLLLLPAALQAQTLRGMLTDSIAGTPLSGYTLRVTNLGNKQTTLAVTDSLGKFQLPGLAHGRYELEIDAFTRTFRRGSFILLPGEALEVEVKLTPAAVELAAVTAVATTRSKKLELAGFYDRLVTGRPQYMLRDEIENKNTRNVTDLISHMKGVRIERSGGFRSDVVMRAGQTMGAMKGAAKTCKPAVYIDGAVARTGGSEQIIALDQLINPENIEAIEVYVGVAQLPVQYSGPTAGCGVILIWTR